MSEPTATDQTIIKTETKITELRVKTEDKILQQKILTLCKKINTVLFFTADVVNSLNILANDVNKGLNKFGPDDSSEEDKAAHYANRVRENLLPEVKAAFDGIGELVSGLIEVVGSLCSLKLQQEKDTQEELSRLGELKQQYLQQQAEIQKNRKNSVVELPVPNFDLKEKQTPFNSITDTFLCLSSWVVDGDITELNKFGSRLGLDLGASVERAHKVRAKLEDRMRRMLVIKHRAESTAYFATLITPVVYSNKERKEIESKSCERSKRKGVEKQFWEALKSLISACNEYLTS